MEKTANYLIKGNQLKREGKWKEAIVSYRQAIEINPKSAWSHHNLGESLVKIGLLDEAITSYRRAIEINPKSAWSYYELAEIFATKGEFNVAIPNYRRACELDSKLLVFSDSLKKALEQLDDKSQTFFEEAKIHFANRLWQETINSCRQAIEMGVEDYECYRILAWSLKKRRQWKEAIAAYAKLVELNPTDREGYYWWGDILKIQGRLAKAIVVYKRGLEKLPDDLKLSAHLEEILAIQNQQQKQLETEVSVNPNVSKYRTLAASQKKLGNLDAAIIAYRQAIEIQPIGLDYYEMGILLVEKQQWEEALFCYQKLLEIQPWVGREIKQFLSLGITLVKAGKVREVIDCYHQIFQKKVENLEFYYQLSIRLSQTGLLNDAVAFFVEMPKPQLPKLPEKEQINSKEDISKYEKIWDWFNRCDTGDFNLDIDLDNLKNEAEKISEHFQSQEIKTFVLSERTIEETIFLEQKGISPEYVNLMKIENNGLENIYLNVFNYKEKISNTIQRKQLHPQKYFWCWHRINTPVEFPHTIAEFQYMYSIDPTSGEIVRSNESFLIADSIIFYRFKGREIFYIVVGNFAGEKVALYIPRLKVAIYYNHWERPNQEIYQKFQSLIVTYFQEVMEYVNSNQKKVITSLLGFINNLGHFFWQDVNGIFYCYKNDLLDKIERFALGPYTRMELTSIMPEIPHSKILKVPEMSDSEQFQFFLKNNSFCLRMTEHFINKECTERVYKVAWNKCSPDLMKTLKNIREKKETFPLLWINVRGHNKSWISQEEGYANIINKLSQDFPNLGIVFDGWIDCKDIVENIQKQLKPHIKVYNTLGCPLHESIVWGNYIDAYIAIVGSGLTITSWLNDKPGVAYANRGHLKQKNFWSKVKEKSIEPTFLDFSEIIDVETGGWGNYEIKWEVIYNKILPILRSLE